MSKKLPTYTFNQIKDRIRIPKRDRAVSLTDSEAALLYKFLASENWVGRQTIEIGFAYGYSTAVIAAATGVTHTVIDPFQHQYRNMGINNMKKMGLWKHITHIADFSHFVLPALLKEKRVYDFAFIDGAHLFDTIFLDFYYLEKLIAPGGVIIVHDAALPQTQMVLGWIAANRKDFRLQIMAQKNLCAITRHGDDKRPWQDYHDFGRYGKNGFTGIFTYVRRIIKHI